MGQPVLGILTLYLNDHGLMEEKPIYERMTAAGNKLGLEIFCLHASRRQLYPQSHPSAHL